MNIEQLIGDAKNIAILGHIRPDGDCIGSCLGLANYIRDNYKNISVEVFTEEFTDKFMLLRGADTIRHDYENAGVYELCIAVDVSDKPRLGAGEACFDKALRTLCIDHHYTNEGFADVNVIDSKASAASELMVTLLDNEKISLATAECLYLGIIHDTGVFKHSNTTKKTMELAGQMIEKGVNTTRMIDETFYKKTFLQNRLLGEVLMNTNVYLDGKCIIGGISYDRICELGVQPSDMNGVVDQLRITEGVKCAVYLYGVKEGGCKASIRSDEDVDSSIIAAVYGGGGHIRASGCNIPGSVEEATQSILKEISKQL
ncbi:MAG: bifunctional oligoribonuclease/PAP phosphatase NrnA [Lachnospiraceae bacterium]|nr:bifunctional oligoribonuclease/PAP phosphatase NrnA [Lachnospiraceae bacterium]